ncbi:DUF2993 domain-containing protein [Streptomyces globosus]|jgi:hypothetical protein|uniref:LmeA family phospholipid-binding protein n=1 Tax=Streptomyces globosus TaxID=68209 RepID=UPI0038255BB3
MPADAPTTPAAAEPASAATAPDRPRPGRRRRTVIAATAALAVLLALPAADAFARHRGEDRLADRIAARHPDLRSKPQVEIGGYPFLLGAARGAHPEVRVRADGHAPDGRPVEADVELGGVSREKDGYTASAVDARFTVPFEALAGEAGGKATLSDAGNGRLRIERRALGLPVAVTAELRLQGDTVTLHATSATLAGAPVDPAMPMVRQALAEKQWKLPALPWGLHASEVSVGPDGVTAHARGEDVTLD